MRAPRILLGVTADVSAGLLRGQPELLAAAGWDVHVVSAPGPQTAEFTDLPGVTFHPLPMVRDPALFSDARALLAWIRLLRAIRPDVMSVGTPKAGLLGSVAGAIARVPRRIFVLRGLRYESATGPSRLALKSLERASCLAAHEVLAVSPSLRERAIQDRVAPARKTVVLGKGSSRGVDVERFSTSPAERRAAKAARWPDLPDTPVIGFIGRIHPDKGVGLLAEAVRLLAAAGVPGRLLVIGGSDSPRGESLLAQLKDSGFPVECTGSVPDVAPYLRLMDVFCLPTRREGFPNVVLEASAASLPTVATLATGIPDAVLDGHTGIICQTRSPQELASALRELLQDLPRRETMGTNARTYVESHFQRGKVQASLVEYHTKAVTSVRGKVGAHEIG